MNCEYFYATPEMGICSIDKENIDIEMREIKFCPAFKLWWGAVE